MKINVHGGHNKLTPGAHSLLDELTEDRKVKAKVINLLRAEDIRCMIVLMTKARPRMIIS